MDLVSIPIITSIYLLALGLDLYHRRLFEALLSSIILVSIHWLYFTATGGIFGLIGLGISYIACFLFHVFLYREVLPNPQPTELFLRLIGFLAIIPLLTLSFDIVENQPLLEKLLISIPAIPSTIGFLLLCCGRRYSIILLFVALVSLLAIVPMIFLLRSLS